MLQAIGLSKRQLMKMLCYEGMLYSVFARFNLRFLAALHLVSYAYRQLRKQSTHISIIHSHGWLSCYIFLAILLIVQFILISYTTGSLKNNLLLSKSERWNN